MSTSERPQEATAQGTCYPHTVAPWASPPQITAQAQFAVVPWSAPLQLILLHISLPQAIHRLAMQTCPTPACCMHTCTCSLCLYISLPPWTAPTTGPRNTACTHRNTLVVPTHPPTHSHPPAHTSTNPRSMLLAGMSSIVKNATKQIPGFQCPFDTCASHHMCISPQLGTHV